MPSEADRIKTQIAILEADLRMIQAVCPHPKETVKSELVETDVSFSDPYINHECTVCRKTWWEDL